MKKAFWPTVLFVFSFVLRCLAFAPFYTLKQSLFWAKMHWNGRNEVCVRSRVRNLALKKFFYFFSSMKQGVGNTASSPFQKTRVAKKYPPFREGNFVYKQNLGSNEKGKIWEISAPWRGPPYVIYLVSSSPKTSGIRKKMLLEHRGPRRPSKP